MAVRMLIACILPPVGMACALVLDGHSPGPLSDAGFFVLPAIGLVLLLPFVGGRALRLFVGVAYVGIELIAMFVIGVMLACGLYGACL